VLDPFCGSGTTLEAAARAGRSFAGNDQSPLAIATTRNRLEKAGISFGETFA
jgi:DNA modification methylase